MAKHVYHATLGHLTQVTNNSTVVYWQLLAVNASGKITSEKAGNNVITNRTYDALDRLRTIQAGPSATPTSIQNHTFTYDTIGNLTQRTDALATGGATTENFTYDTLNRLLSRSGSGPGITTQSQTYNAQGNILTKSDVGTYVYGGPRPHAVTGIQAGSGTLGGATFTYDANGNMLTSVDPSLGTRTFTYTSYNLLASVTRGTSSLNFIYGPEHARVKETRVVAGVTTTVYFLNPGNAGALLYEKEETIASSGNTTQHKHYINGPGGVIAVLTTGSVSSTEYWHKDHLGSVTVATNASGAVVAGSRKAFDPWGQSNVAGDGYRGFTTHEQFATFGIIHMNGRVYDPRLGRFTSADPQVQYPDDLQNYNRYTYVNNNPLIHVDMDGYGFLRSLFKIHSIITGEKWTLHPIIQKYPVIGQIGIAAAAIGCSVVGLGAVCAAVASAYHAYILGGSDEDILKAGMIAGATAFAFSQIPKAWGTWSFERLAAHAAIGCASGAASGSGCGRGALSAVAGKVTSNLIGGTPGKFDFGQFVATVVAGGTVSVIGGGKFGNGAITAAFGYLFNHCGHGGCTGGLDEAVLRMQGVPDGDYHNPTITDGDKAVLTATGVLASAPLVAGSAIFGGSAELAVTAHGALRVGAAATRGGTLSPLEVLTVRNEASMIYSQANGAIVRIMETGPGRFSGVVDGSRGVITTFRNFSQRAIDRLGKNYGWTSVK